MRIRYALAQRPGTTPPCADGVDVQAAGDQVAAAVVDGAGHHPGTVRYASIAPAVITHFGITHGGLSGLITAGQMAHAYDTIPIASAVYARMEPGLPTGIHWIGDCRAYGWDGNALRQYSTDQTMGEYLRRNGVAVEVAEEHDNWSRTSLFQATAATCQEAWIPEDVPLVMLVSDGISDQVDTQVWESLCQMHGNAPQALADALVAAADEDVEGYRDDATVAVLLRA